MKRLAFLSALIGLFAAGCLFASNITNTDPYLRTESYHSMLLGSLTYYEGDIKDFYIVMTETINPDKKLIFKVDVGGVGNNYFHFIIPQGRYNYKEWRFSGKIGGKAIEARGSFGKVAKSSVSVKSAQLIYGGRILISMIGARVFMTIEDAFDEDIAWFSQQYPNNPWLKLETSFPVTPRKNRFSDDDLKKEAMSLIGSDVEMPSDSTDPVNMITPGQGVEELPFAAPEDPYAIE